jgi:hypothetical protein
MSRAPALAALLAACAAAPGPRPALDLSPLAMIEHATFAGREAILGGFDAPSPAADWRVGDSALFGLEVHRGASVERRLLRLRVARRTGRPRIDLRDGRFLEGHQTVRTNVSLRRADGHATGHTLSLTPIEVQVTHFDADGTERSGSSVELYEELLATGLHPLASGTDEARQIEASLLLFMLQRLGTADPTLGELLFTVVERPSILSVLWHFGVDVRLVGHEGRPGTSPAGVPDARDVAVLPLDVLVNGSPALHADIVVAPPRHPYAVTGGVLGAVVRHASDPRRVAVLRLLAARRGPPP